LSSTSVAEGHAHDVDVDTTFDFLNTLDLDDGFLVEKLPTLDLALGWFADRGLIHREGSDRARKHAAAHPRVAARDLERVHTVRDAISNGIGRVTLIHYQPSTAFALADAAAGQPWTNLMPLSVSVSTF
jgi:hypothetical protein